MKFKLPILMLVLVFGLVGLVSATATLVTPAASATVDTATLTLFANSTINQSSLVFSALCTDTANSSSVTICTNSSPQLIATDGTNGSCTWTVSHFEDSSSCTFTVTGNTTTETDSSASVVIDLTAPTAPTSLSPADGDKNKQSALTVSAAVTGSETTACTVAWENDKYPEGGSPDTLTHSGDTCTFSYDNVPDGTYTYIMTLSDGLNTTDSSRTSFTVDTSGSGASVAIAQIAQAEEASKK